MPLSEYQSATTFTQGNSEGQDFIYKEFLLVARHKFSEVDGGTETELELIPNLTPLS